MWEFTKGKWKYEETENNPINGTWYQITDEEGLIAICTRDNDFARLIATAPEMYKFIEFAFLTKDSRHLDWEVLEESAASLLARIDTEEHEELHEVEA